MPTRILIALKPEPLPTVVAALEGYELLIAKDKSEAKKLILENDIDICVIGILFDDSSGMELIKIIRLGERNKNTPLFITRFMPSQHERMLRSTLETMVAIGTVSDYFESDYRAPGIESTVRSRVEKFLPAEKVISRKKSSLKSNSKSNRK